MEDRVDSQAGRLPLDFCPQNADLYNRERCGEMNRMQPAILKPFSYENFPSSGHVAYFSMEIAIHPSMPTYSGGLGVLAGDTLRSAADLGIPCRFLSGAPQRIFPATS